MLSKPESNFSNILIVIPSLIFSQLFIFGILFVSPLHLFRFIVSKSSKLFNPSLGNILSPFQIRQNLKSIGGNCEAFSYSCIAGDVDLEKLRLQIKHVLRSEISSGRSGQGQTRFPEMRQTISSWMGFKFWKWDDSFDINYHVKNYNEGGNSIEEITEDKLAQIISQITQKPVLHFDKPSWEILIIRNFLPNPSSLPKNIKKCMDRKYSVVLFHSSNALLSGQYWNQIFQEICDTPEFHSVQCDGKQVLDFNSTQSQTTLITVKELLLNHLKMPFDFTKEYFAPKNKKCMQRIYNASKSESKHEFQLVFGNLYDLQYFEGISESLKVNMESILLAGISRSIRTFMEICYITPGHVLPEFLKMRINLPNQSGKSSLSVTKSTIEIPISEEDPLVRLQMAEQNFKDLTKSTAPQMICYMDNVLGGDLFPFVKINSSLSNAHEATDCVSGVISTNITSHTQMKLQGNVVIDRIDENLLDEGVCIVFNTTRYAGRIRLSLIVDKTIIPNLEDSKLLLHFIEKEFEVLKKLAEF